MSFQLLIIILCNESIHCLFGSFFAQIPLVNDELPGRIISGRVQIRPNVKEFCGSSVVFVDGSILVKVCFNYFIRYIFLLYSALNNECLF